MNKLPLDNFDILPTLFQLRQIKTPQVGKAYLVENTGQQFYYDNADTTTADNGIDVFVPYGTTHRIKLKSNSIQTFQTTSQMRNTVGANANPAIQGTLYYINETNKQGFWYYSASDTTTADNEGTVIVTTTGSHRLKRVFLNASYVYKNWFTGSNSYFNSVTDANTTLGAAYRLRGMRLLIMDTVVEEYWYRDGTADSDLVPVAGTIGITNGDSSDSALTNGYVPSSSSIGFYSTRIKGATGSGLSVTATHDTVNHVNIFEINNTGLSTFQSGDYEDMPSPTQPGITYYATNQLFGRYLSTGTIWAYMPGTDTLVYEQWLANTPAFYAQSVSGAGSGSFIDSSTIGRWRNDTGTTTTGTSSVRLSQSICSSFSGVNKIVMYVERVQLSALSDGTNRYTARIGRDVGSDVNGVWFEYSDNVNSGKWLCVNCNSGTRTTSDSGVTVSASATYTMCWVLDFSGTDTVHFYINGVEVGTPGGHTTNIPANLTSAYPFSMSIEKSLGTTSRGLMIGRTLINCEFTTGI